MHFELDIFVAEGDRVLKEEARRVPSDELDNARVLSTMLVGMLIGPLL